MRDPFGWSISLGRWGGIGVRLHVFFLMFALATLYLGWHGSSSRLGDDLDRMALVAISVLLVSVLWHEWCHWWIAELYGRAPDTLVLGPLGGLTKWGDGVASRGEFACLLAGPLANLLVCLVCLGLLHVVEPQTSIWVLLDPLKPGLTEKAVPLSTYGLMLGLWVNWLLFLFNLLPAFPFDGGHLLRSALTHIFSDWPQERVTETVYWIAMALAAVIMTLAIVLWKHEAGAVYPVSFAFLLLAVVLVFSAQRDRTRSVAAVPVEGSDREREEPWPTRLAREEGRTEPSLAESWLPPEMPAEPPCREEIEAQEEQQVDEILSRLHVHGLDSLTSEERHVLERVSARYRDRLGRHT